MSLLQRVENIIFNVTRERIHIPLVTLALHNVIGDYFVRMKKGEERYIVAFFRNNLLEMIYIVLESKTIRIQHEEMILTSREGTSMKLFVEFPGLFDQTTIDSIENMLFPQNNNILSGNYNVIEMRILMNKREINATDFLRYRISDDFYDYVYLEQLPQVVNLNILFDRLINFASTYSRTFNTFQEMTQSGIIQQLFPEISFLQQTFSKIKVLVTEFFDSSYSILVNYYDNADNIYYTTVKIKYSNGLVSITNFEQEYKNMKIMNLNPNLNAYVTMGYIDDYRSYIMFHRKINPQVMLGERIIAQNGLMPRLDKFSSIYIDGSVLLDSSINKFTKLSQQITNHMDVFFVYNGIVAEFSTDKVNGNWIITGRRTIRKPNVIYSLSILYGQNNITAEFTSDGEGYII